MTKVLEDKTYWLTIDGNSYLIRHQLIWDKNYPSTPYWNTYINGELKPNRYSWMKRYTKPSKTEIRKYIEKYY